MTDTTDHVTVDPNPASTPNEAGVLQQMISALSSVPEDSRKRLIDTVCVFLGLSSPSKSEHVPLTSTSHAASTRSASFQFSEDDTLSIKEFMRQKNPQTDVERVACLAYYLARYRATPHVKTKDITELCKESAHRPFSNTAFAVDNATKTGYLVPSIKGSKQISAHGERFVEALPDRDAAKEIMSFARAGRRSKPVKKSPSGPA